MAKKGRAKLSKESHDRVSVSSPPFERWHSILLAAFVALLVARTLVPEDTGGQFGHGAPFSVLWLLLVGAWLLGEFRRTRLRLQFNWIDGLVAALFVWHTMSALVAVQTGEPRSAMNMMWDWLAMGCVYFLARQILTSEQDARACIVVMLGLACGMAAVTIHQYFFTLPGDAAIFEAAKHSVNALFEQTGQWLPEGSSIRQQFEARLASRLPTATFALSNSLAGFLVIWLVMLAGIALHLRGRIARAVAIVVAIAFGVCIWLAGSRSAALGAAFGIGLVVVDRMLANGVPRGWVRVGLVAASAALAAAIAFAVATPVGRHAMESAWRSMAFRLEYWRATSAMIADMPILGSGPGQFQDNYTAYKLVGAAEEVRDPHNWLLEVWATAGTPAAVFLVAAIVAVVARTCRATDRQRLEVAANSGPAASEAALFGGVAGIVQGVVIAWITGYALSQVSMVILVAGIVGGWFVWKAWVLEGTLSPRLSMIAVLALLVNLLAAGGIGYPNVADSLWLLLAIQVNGTCGNAETQSRTTIDETSQNILATVVRWLVAGALFAAIVSAIWFEYLPVMACRTHLAAADQALSAGRGDMSRAEIEAGAAADPWSALAAARLADQRFADYQALPTESLRRVLQAADSRVRELAPLRSKIWAQSAEYAIAIFRDTQSVVYRNAAERFLQRALELYPTSAELHGQAARMWTSFGEADRARSEALEAMRLDDALREAGHDDRALRPTTRSELEKIAQE